MSRRDDFDRWALTSAAGWDEFTPKQLSRRLRIPLRTAQGLVLDWCSDGLLQLFRPAVRGVCGPLYRWAGE